MDNSLGAIASYLRYIEKEAKKRGYKFNSNKIINKRIKAKILVNSGQIEYEFKHLLKKLKEREPNLYKKLKDTRTIKLHPLFKKKKGGVEEWEILS